MPDCDTTACAFSAATQAGSTDPILDQPLLDFYAGYQVDGGANEPQVTVPLNDNIDYEGGVVTWIDNLAGERPFGNDLDPTLNLDILEVSFRNLSRWKIIETPQRLRTVQRIIGFQKRLALAARSPIRGRISIICRSSIAPISAAATPRSCALPLAARRAIDPDGAFDLIRTGCSAYVAGRIDRRRDERVRCRAGADRARPSRRRHRRASRPPLHCIIGHLGEGGRHGPFKAYEWNKMKTPTRILVGGPEVTSAFVLMGLALARRAMLQEH